MQEFDKIVDVEIVDEMKKSYIDYAMSVIVARALPDVRDGLKPVHRRIIYAMNELGLEPSKAHKKCARIVGDTMGKYHPHGDAAIYDALVRLAQTFTMRYTLVDGHGNFGNIDGYPAAAQRYTEARLAKAALPMLADIEKNTVDFIDNYDGEFKEPTVLPSRFPNLLVNGSSGIAVGMATNIPPHNLREVISGVIRIIDNSIEGRDTDIEELMEIIKGPDFPTGASILGKSGIREAYMTGRGKLKLRATAEIINEKGREKIIFSDVPYQVNKAFMIKKIAELVKEKKIEGISDIHDASGRETGIKIIIDCKKDANANVVLNQLYKYSQLQESYSINFLAIVKGEPKVLNIKQMLVYYLDFQKEVVERRTKFDLNKALDRMHIVEGLLKALDSVDEVIKIIRSSKVTSEAKENLIERFGFTDAQVSAIIEMRFRSLTGLEKEKLVSEYSELKNLVEYLDGLLNDDKKLYGVIKDELTDISKKYGDERRTQIVLDEGEIDVEDLINDEMSVITLSSLNYIKRQPLSIYKSQNRGGKGIIGMQTRDEDFVKDLILSSNHTELLVFTNKGKVYNLKTYEIPEAGRTAKGTPVINLLRIENGEKVSAVVPVKEKEQGHFLTMITRKGIIKKSSVSLFNKIRKMGIIAITLNDDDELISVCETSGDDDIFIVTKNGMSIRFSEKDVRSMGRSAAGVKAIKLKQGDEVISGEIIQDGFKALLVSEKGFGKCTEMSEFKSQSRGGIGIRSYKISEKTGNVIDAKIVSEKEELMMITSEGIIIRIRVSDISVSKRITQGVKLINVGDNVYVVSVAKIAEDCIESSPEQV